MNHKITHMFVVKSGTSLLTSGSTADLIEGQVGVFNSSYQAVSAAPSVSSSPFLLLAQGSGKETIGSWKTPKVYLSKVTRWAGDSADTTDQEQITYVGWDEINDCNSPTIGCDKTYNITIRVFEHYLRSVYAKSLQEGVTVKSACCEDCGSNCDSLDAKVIFDEFAEKINANPRLKKYVTASVVSKLISGSEVDPTFCLVVPDPGTHIGGIADVKLDTTAATGFTDGAYTAITPTSTSGSGTSGTFNFTVAGGILTAVVVNAAGSGYAIGEVITFAGTKITGGTTPADDFTITVTETTGPEGVLIGEIRDFYSAYVDDVETDIVYSTDTDSSDTDANATGNVMIVMTPSTGVTIEDIDPFNGVAWTECPCATESTAVYAVGLKLVGITPEDFENSCLPDSIPYIANKVRFKVYAGEGPVGTQYVDLPNFCDLWAVNTTQEVKYLVGEGRAIAEIERNTYNWKEPYAKRYWINYFNDDLKYFVDSTLEYDIYYLEFKDPSGDEFSQKDPDGCRIMIAVPSTMTSWKTAFETVMNSYLANSPAYQGTVTL